MRVIIAGSREITDYGVVQAAVSCSRFPITAVISGGARGVDTLAERWAAEHGIPFCPVLPDWQENGRAAGMIRNEQMAAMADGLIAIWDGRSRGTKHMIATAERRGLRVSVYRVTR